MTEDPNLHTLVAAHCTTATQFEELLSTLLRAAHENGVDVSGGWEAHDVTEALEWDVVITPMARDGAGTGSDDAS